jgi:heme-degrading monooxygenase HmoA
MTDTIDPTKREAAAPSESVVGPVTLVNSFVVPADRDAAFVDIWTQTSGYFRSQPGFLSLRLHRAVSPDAQYRFVNVANWSSLEQFRAAHQTETFRQLVGQPGWQEFPSRPALYQVEVAYDASEVAAAH